MALPIIAVIPTLITWAVAHAIFKAVAKIVVTLGVGWVTFQGSELLFTEFEAQIRTHWDGIPTDLVGLLYAVGLDKAFSTVLTGAALGVSIRVLLTGARSFKWLPNSE
jgi:hypothetical protein